MFEDGGFVQTLQVGFVLGPVDKFFKVQCPQSGAKIYLETTRRLPPSIRLLGSFEDDVAMVKYSI